MAIKDLPPPIKTPDSGASNWSQLLDWLLLVWKFVRTPALVLSPSGDAPTTPTGAAGDASSQIANDAFVQQEIASKASAASSLSAMYGMSGVEGVLSVMPTPITPPVAGLQGAFKNLKGSSTGVSSILTYTIDELLTGDALGNYQSTRAWSGTIDMTVSGIGGIDSGTVAASTWYYSYGVTKLDGTKGFIASLSSITPLLPAGYSKWARIGSFKTDPSGNKYPFPIAQFDRWIQYAMKTASNLTAYPIIASGTATYPTSTSLSSVFPPTAGSGQVKISSGGSNSCEFSPNNVVTAADCFLRGNTANTDSNGTGRFVIESFTVYFGATDATFKLSAIGWEDSL